VRYNEEDPCYCDKGEPAWLKCNKCKLNIGKKASGFAFNYQRKYTSGGFYNYVSTDGFFMNSTHQKVMS